MAWTLRSIPALFAASNVFEAHFVVPQPAGLTDAAARRELEALVQGFAGARSRDLTYRLGTDKNGCWHLRVIVPAEPAMVTALTGGSLPMSAAWVDAGGQEPLLVTSGGATRYFKLSFTGGARRLSAADAQVFLEEAVGQAGTVLGCTPYHDEGMLSAIHNTFLAQTDGPAAKRLSRGKRSDPVATMPPPAGSPSGVAALSMFAHPVGLQQVHGSMRAHRASSDPRGAPAGAGARAAHGQASPAAPGAAPRPAWNAPPRPGAGAAAGVPTGADANPPPPLKAADGGRRSRSARRKPPPAADPAAPAAAAPPAAPAQQGGGPQPAADPAPPAVAAQPPAPAQQGGGAQTAADPASPAVAAQPAASAQQGGSARTAAAPAVQAAAATPPGPAQQGGAQPAADPPAPAAAARPAAPAQQGGGARTAADPAAPAAAAPAQRGGAAQPAADPAAPAAAAPPAAPAQLDAAAVRRILTPLRGGAREEQRPCGTAGGAPSPVGGGGTAQEVGRSPVGGSQGGSPAEQRQPPPAGGAQRDLLRQRSQSLASVPEENVAKLSRQFSGTLGSSMLRQRRPASSEAGCASDTDMQDD